MEVRFFGYFSVILVVRMVFQITILPNCHFTIRYGNGYSGLFCQMEEGGYGDSRITGAETFVILGFCRFRSISCMQGA